VHLAAAVGNPRGLHRGEGGGRERQAGAAAAAEGAQGTAEADGQLLARGICPPSELIANAWIASIPAY